LIPLWERACSRWRWFSYRATRASRTARSCGEGACSRWGAQRPPKSAQASLE
jgi:hypothetical protein